MRTVQIIKGLVLFSLLLTISEAYNNLRGNFYENNEDHKNHWVFIHYHKTGHDLSIHLAEVFESPPCSADVDKRFKKRTDARVNKNLISKLDISVMAAPDMPFDWNTDLLGKDDESMKFVHHVRDPFDMVVSGYLYHSEDPPPAPETWLLKDDFNPCLLHEEKTLERYVDVISRHVGMDQKVFYRMIAETKQLCEELVDKAYRTAGVKEFNPVLRSFKDPLDGLFLEAARALLSGSGGDILRMAANAIYETESNIRSNIPALTDKFTQVQNVSKREFLADFPVGGKDAFRRTVTDLYNFLTAYDSYHRSRSHAESLPFWTCLNIPQAVERAVGTAYVDPNVNEKCSESEKKEMDKDDCRLASHVTHSSGVDRTIFISALKKHSLFGPLLDAVNTTIHYF